MYLVCSLFLSRRSRLWQGENCHQPSIHVWHEAHIHWVHHSEVPAQESPTHDDYHLNWGLLPVYVARAKDRPGQLVLNECTYHSVVALWCDISVRIWNFMQASETLQLTGLRKLHKKEKKWVEFASVGLKHPPTYYLAALTPNSNPISRHFQMLAWKCYVDTHVAQPDECNSGPLSNHLSGCWPCRSTCIIQVLLSQIEDGPSAWSSIKSYSWRLCSWKPFARTALR